MFPKFPRDIFGYVWIDMNRVCRQPFKSIMPTLSSEFDNDFNCPFCLVLDPNIICVLIIHFFSSTSTFIGNGHFQEIIVQNKKLQNKFLELNTYNRKLPMELRVEFKKFQHGVI